MKPRYALLALALSAALASASHAQTAAATAATEAAAPSAGTAQAATRLSLEAAIAAALAKVPGQAIEAELDADKGQPVIDVDVVDARRHKIEIRLDALSGAVLRQEDDGLSRKDAREAAAARITLADAIGRAQAHAGAKAVKAELDTLRDRRTLVYKIDLQGETEVLVDALSGQVRDRPVPAN